jgi:hypothetical protein
MDEQVEYLRLHMNNRAGAAQLPARSVDLEIGEAKTQGFPRLQAANSFAPPDEGYKSVAMAVCEL